MSLKIVHVHTCGVCGEQAGLAKYDELDDDEYELPTVPPGWTTAQVKFAYNNPDYKPLAVLMDEQLKSIRASGQVPSGHKFTKMEKDALALQLSAVMQPKHLFLDTTIHLCPRHSYKLVSLDLKACASDEWPSSVISSMKKRGQK